MKLLEQIKADRDAGTPGTWESEAGNGPRSSWYKSNLGVWSHHKFDAAVELDDERDPDDEKWLCGIWGEIDQEDLANARRIARVPQLEALVLEMAEALQEVERWWLEDEMHKQLGAPVAIFMTRAILTKLNGETT